MPRRKDTQQPQPRRLEPVAGSGLRRLTGDALFAWATLQAEARQLQQQIDGFLRAQAEELGLDLENEGIDPGGYIRPIQARPSQVQLGEGMARAPEGDATEDNG